jgi:HD superfamily phosphohydrolase
VDAHAALDGLLSSTHFGALVAEVDTILSPSISEYRSAATPASKRPPTKAVKDAVWGMIDLTQREVVVVDSPPLQRLRRIRQLGLGYLTYPTAGYSRFEHSLGALNQADRMLRAVASRTGRAVKKAGETISIGEQEVLASLWKVRLAALLHDIGHMPLSHVSERYFMRAECPDASVARQVERIVADVQRGLDTKPPSLSECLSLATVLAPSFKGLLTDVADYSVDDVVAAACAIVGRPPSSRDAFIPQLITNVIDADKLDYMFRDGMHTGVPLAVDLERLLFKLKCVQLSVEEMPVSLREMRTDDDPALVLGIDVAGRRLAYDVAIARTMLFERVYLHHKTRAAERLALSLLSDLSLSPAQLLMYDDSLFGPYGDTVIGNPRRALGRRIADRDLPRRAYAMDYGFLAATANISEEEGPQVSLESEDAWRRLTADLKKPEMRRQLERKALQIAQSLARRLTPAPVVRDMWIDTEPKPPDPGTWDLWVEKPDETKERAAMAYAADSAAYAHSPTETFFVYTSGDDAVAQVAFLAVELVLAEAYGLFCGRAAADYAKLSFASLEQLKRRLESDLPGLYISAGRLRPEPGFLLSATGKQSVADLARLFGHYNANAKVRVDERRIGMFLRQFPEPLAEQMLAVLPDLIFLDRDRLGEDLADFMVQGAKPDECYVPLTKQADKSALHLPYFLADNRAARLPIAQLDEALQGDHPLTFFDDVLVSGRQTKTVLQTLLGLEPCLPDETGLVEPLDEEHIAALKSRRIRFRFGYGWQRGLDDLSTFIQEEGLGEDVAALERRAERFSELSGVSAELCDFLRAVGQELLLSTKAAENPDKWTPERCEEYALGYGDCQQFAVTFYNAPTGTLVPLWKSGRFHGTPWLPLFPRRGELGVTRKPSPKQPA